MSPRMLGAAAALALAILGVQPVPAGSATTAGASLGTTVRPVASLSLQERLQLPADTKVMVGKRLVTLGVLRAEHQRRLQRFASALSSSSVANASVLQNSGLRMQSTATEIVNPLDCGYTVPCPRDYQMYCAPAKAAICLYYPASTSLWDGGGDVSDTDPYITDSTICKSEGGMLTTQGCEYLYPNWRNIQFDPGTGPPFKYKATCDPKYWKVDHVDKHGAIGIAKINNGQTFETGPAASTCVVRVWLQQ